MPQAAPVGLRQAVSQLISMVDPQGMWLTLFRVSHIPVLLQQELEPSSSWMCLGDHSLAWLNPSLLATDYLMPTAMV